MHPDLLVQFSSRSSFMADSITFAYDGRVGPVFQNFSLHTQPGEFVAILGPSGCGKSTLLNLLSGFLTPQKGTIEINGSAVYPEHPALGYVFQSPNLFPWLSVLENVRFGLRMAAKLSKGQQYQTTKTFLDLVGLTDHANAFPHRLSGGQRQRVALARSLVMNPALLLMDEPFSALDAITRATLNDEVLRLWSTLGQSVLFITHDIDEAIYLADRIIVLGLAPEGIRAEVKVALPRPRHQVETRDNPRFHALRRQLSQEIANAQSKTPF